ncbi:hypothetical protein [Thiocystis violacea]|uniref:hypothetical protein n=1 Tax=Thiocystis violacea TaxID=13725 RepID=UPI001904F3D8|nr:hypothetical protein [Thiocystis violacea]MBK1723386.1 hypothetical protein [Thiocystis violacea]
MSAAQLYQARLALIGEGRELRAEQTELGPRMIEAGTRQREAATQLQNCTARTRGALDDPEQQARQIEADASDVALRNLRARGEEIRARLAVLEHEAHQPIVLTDKDIKGHLTSLDAARQAVTKLEAAATKQAELVGALASGPDVRSEHAARRAELSAKVLLGEAATADLERLDQEAEPALRNADALSARLEEAQAVADVLAHRLVLAHQALADLAPLTALCAQSIAATELEAASQAWQELAAREIEARNRLTGLDQLFRSLGGNPPARQSFDPLSLTEAARLERERLSKARPALF